jgi:hypothetical protein
LSEQEDARWQDIMEARVDFDDDPVPLRSVGGNEVRRQRSSSRKSARFNEALSDLGSWSSVESSRRRMSA